MTQPPAAPNHQEDAEFRRLEQRLEAARKELVEATTRTRLLHTPLGSSRAKIIDIKKELAEQVLGVLVREGTQMTFLAAPEPQGAAASNPAVPLRRSQCQAARYQGLAL